LKPKAYSVLLESHFPYNLTFHKNDAIRAAREIKPKAVSKVSRKNFSEPLLPNELAEIFASCDPFETRTETISRVKLELSQYWEANY
jgi:hypothetical protein